jgi:hypothetical protein
MIFLLSCILTKSSDLSALCLKNECDTGTETTDIDIIFQPSVPALGDELFCLSSQLFPYGTQEWTWVLNGEKITFTGESLSLEDNAFQPFDVIHCTIKWFEAGTLFAKGDGLVVIEEN